ncbi:amine oxidase [Elysia marginata]|uniref:Amine oxidase n=1 Tax=Elysia marginata TaxID=1093978 RepID=A0AAV4FCA4_9GAST|nr:amine oxidase [Elysia marginata]
MPFNESVNEEDCELCNHYNSFNIGGIRERKTVIDDLSGQASECPISAAAQSSVSFTQEQGQIHTAQASPCTDYDIHMDYDDTQDPFQGQNAAVEYDTCATFQTQGYYDISDKQMHTSDQTHRPDEDANNDMLMRLARALESGDCQINENSNWETTLNEPLMSHSPDVHVPAITSTPFKPPTDPSYSVFKSMPHSTPSSHLITESFYAPTPPLHTSTPVKSYTDSSTSPMKTPTKQKSSVIETGTSPLMKGPLIILGQKDEDTPLTLEEEVVTTKLVRRKINTSSSNDTLKFKTSGQPIVFERSIMPRKSSATACSPLRRKRAKKIKQIRSRLSGSSGKDLEKQHVSEIKRIKGKARKKLEGAMGLSKTTFTAEEALAMKETMNITYHQFKLQSKFLKSIGTHLPNEHAVRALHKNLARDDVEIINKQFNSTKSEDKYSKEVAFIKNLPSFVSKILNKLKTNDQLTWHNTIPEDEIWIKVGGDHGKGSFKMSLHICNVKKPNSKDNTHLIALAKVPHTTHNIKVIIDHLQAQIHELTLMKWKEKTMKLFVFGDYLFLSKLCGLSGPSGSYPCLWCHVSKHQMQDETNATSEPRTLESLRSDSVNFERAGSDKRKAKHFHNAVYSPLLNIALNYVSPPYLHVLLGLVLKHHNNLEDDVKYFDQEISIEKSRIVGVPSLLEKYGCNWEKADLLKDQKDFVKACIIMCGTTDKKELKHFQRELNKIKDKLHDLKEPDPSYRGPVLKAIGVVLDQHNIVRQAFHGGSFIGNHCHRYITQKLYKQFTKTAIDTVASNTQQDVLITKVIQLEQKYNKINDSFRAVHLAVSHSQPLTLPTDTEKAEEAIKVYMKNYREAFPNKITPKHHILEKHCVNWMREHRFGMGFHGEQGGEMLHSTIAKIEHRARGLRHERTKMAFTMETSILQTTPELTGLVPQPLSKKQ